MLYQSILEHPWFDARENHYYRWYPKSLTKFSPERPLPAANIDGVYIHVPFCDKLCSFCPYIRGVSNEKDIDLFLKALIKEIDQYARHIRASSLSFIYFGGGTPSVLTEGQVTIILNKLNDIWGIGDDTEVTLETHPSHARVERLEGYGRAGVNRVSMGIQSFDEANLLRLGATHDASQSRHSLDSAGKIFDNVAVDLIYSYDSQSEDSWDADLSLALDHGSATHLSCYPIIPTSKNISQKPALKEVSFALWAIERAKEAGMSQYASCSSGGFDLAFPHKRSKYELLHWAAPQARFIGLGPGAFGYTGSHSTVNTPRTKDYFSLLLENGRSPLISAHEISEAEQKHRYFSLGVKTYVIPFEPYIRMFDEHPSLLFGSQFETLENGGLASMSEDALELTATGRLYIDECSALFFSPDERPVPHPEEREISLLNK